MKTTIAALILAPALGFAATTANAAQLGRACTDQPSNTWISIEKMTEMLKAEGYQVKSGSFEKRCGDFYVIDKDGKEAELFLDPTNGKIVGRK